MSSELVLKLVPNIRRPGLVIRILFENVSELCVGAAPSGIPPSASDNPVAKMPALVRRDGGLKAELVPYVPGSTLKGAIRSMMEETMAARGDILPAREILSAIGEWEKSGESKYWKYKGEVIDKLLYPLLSQVLDEDIAREVSEGARRSDRILEGVVAKAEELGVRELVDAALDSYGIYFRDGKYLTCNPVLEGLCCELPLPAWKLRALEGRVAEYPCAVCRVMGLPGYESKLTFFDAWPTDVDRVILLMRTHIAIDRLRGTVAQEKTFDIEFIAPGAEFEAYAIYYTHAKLEITGNEIKVSGLQAEQEAENLKNLVDLLKALVCQSSLQVGKRKTIGLGEVRIKEIKVAQAAPRRGSSGGGPVGESEGALPEPLAALRETLGRLATKGYKDVSVLEVTTA